MTEVPDDFDFLAWHNSIAEFMWWEDPLMRYSWDLLKRAQQAHSIKQKFWLQDPMGREPLDLTDLYEKFKLIVILRRDYNE